jgi:hypothetical protein
MPGATFGSTWRPTMASQLAPLARAAVMKSAPRSLAVSVSAMRAMGGTRMIDRAMMALDSPEPSAAAIAIASSTAGKA